MLFSAAPSVCRMQPRGHGRMGARAPILPCQQHTTTTPTPTMKRYCGFLSPLDLLLFSPRLVASRGDLAGGGWAKWKGVWW